MSMTFQTIFCSLLENTLQRVQKPTATPYSAKFPVAIFNVIHYLLPSQSEIQADAGQKTENTKPSTGQILTQHRHRNLNTLILILQLTTQQLKIGFQANTKTIISKHWKKENQNLLPELPKNVVQSRLCCDGESSPLTRRSRRRPPFKHPESRSPVKPQGKPHRQFKEVSPQTTLANSCMLEKRRQKACTMKRQTNVTNATKIG